MTNSKNIEENKEHMLLLRMQIDQKIKQMDNSTKLYFQSVFILAAGIAIVITALAAIRDLDKILIVLTFGAPAFLISWAGCFIFIYWEHHMIRISYDYSEKMMAEIMKTPPNEIFLYHEDFLGVLNQTIFLPKLYPFNKLQIKSVQLIFAIIGLPVVMVFIASIWKANEYFSNTYFYLVYAGSNIAFALILLGIHLQSLRKERQLKNVLNIIPWYMRQEEIKKG